MNWVAWGLVIGALGALRLAMKPSTTHRRVVWWYGGNWHIKYEPVSENE